jgi:hypothetical protein
MAPVFLVFTSDLELANQELRLLVLFKAPSLIADVGK